MIETNLDSCVGPLHCVSRTKFLVWCSSSPFGELVLVEPFLRIGARRALFKDGARRAPFLELVLVEPS